MQQENTTLENILNDHFLLYLNDMLLNKFIPTGKLLLSICI